MFVRPTVKFATFCPAWQHNDTTRLWNTLKLLTRRRTEHSGGWCCTYLQFPIQVSFSCSRLPVRYRICFCWFRCFYRYHFPKRDIFFLYITLNSDIWLWPTKAASRLTFFVRQRSFRSTVIVRTHIRSRPAAALILWPQWSRKHVELLYKQRLRVTLILALYVMTSLTFYFCFVGVFSSANMDFKEFKT